jgi:hypothetical protein
MLEVVEIKINGKPYFISANAAVPIRYKCIFGRNIFDDFLKIKNNKDKNLLVCLLFCMTDKSPREFCKFFIENNSYITDYHHDEVIRLLGKEMTYGGRTYSLESAIEILISHLGNTKT